MFFCGKMASGKSTLAKQLAEREDAVLLVQDEWLDTLFPGLIVNVASYLEYAGRINKMAAPHVAAILSKGVSVVLDFPANTRNQRAWFRRILDESGVEHELHFVNTSRRASARRSSRRAAPICRRARNGRPTRTSS